MTKPIPLLIAKSRERMPNHLFYGTLRHLEDKRVVARKMLTELYLPSSHRGEVEVIFHATPEQIPALQFVPAVSLYARSHAGRYVLKSDEIWHQGQQTGQQDGIAFMYPCKGRASNLEIRNLLRKSKSQFVKDGLFWLTECRLINTAMTLVHSYTGSVHARRIASPTFTLGSGVRLAFRKNFSEDRDTGKKLGQLVAEFKPKAQLSDNTLRSVIADLDDFLILVSFAARRRCICTGWSYFDEKGNLTRFYRRNYVLPPDSRQDVDDALIPMRNFMKFLRVAYRSFGRSSHPELIRNTIFSLTSDGGTLDNEFLRLFAGLESVLLYAIRARSGGKLPKLYQKFDFFQAIYKVDLSDLWPLLNTSSGTSLAQIRNRSIHGEYLTDGSYRALTYATHNLRWTLERMLLTVLGWQVNESHVSSSFLSHLTTYRWQPMRGKI